MRLHSDGKTIFLNTEEAKKLCHPGAGADTCIWLVVGQEGLECIYYNKSGGLNLLGETLESRWKRGDTVAKRDGCDVVRSLEKYKAGRPAGVKNESD